jgi:DNA-binding transcriptional ArsR family regulator
MKKQTAAIFEALSHRARLRIVGYLGKQPRRTAELAKLLKINESAVDHHLQIFRDVGLVHSARTGDTAVHELDRARLARALDELRAVAGLDA